VMEFRPHSSDKGKLHPTQTQKKARDGRALKKENS
jgi:hypothetical protein